MELNWIALTVFILLFGFITWLGFAAAHWRRGDLDQLHEWGLGGRRFGTLITWFLLGGDIYTAYTFIAVRRRARGRYFWRRRSTFRGNMDRCEFPSRQLRGRP